MAASPSQRCFEDALALLGTLQSNTAVRSVLDAASSASNTSNNAAIPEMIEWVKKAGYDVNKDFQGLKVIHVAGTKGKGSVCAMVDSILNQYRVPGASNYRPWQPTSTDGFEPEKQSITDGDRPQKIFKPKTLGRVGMYTSPHLLSVCERITIDGSPISENLFAKYFFSLWDRFSASAAASGHKNPTSSETKPMYFRYLTIMALHCFIGEGVHNVVLECGIGGEYDSTNILPASSTTVTAITRLGLDHLGMLGSNLADIAWHKSGIMKSGVETFTVVQEREAATVLSKRISEKGASALEVVDARTDVDDGKVKLGLEGEFQKSNANLAAAVAAAHLDKVGVLPPQFANQLLRGGKFPTQFQEGLAKVRWRGRCETIKEDNVEWCVDGAHTIDSIEVAGKWFAEKIQQTSPTKSILIFNQQERDTEALLGALQKTINQTVKFDHAIFCTNTPSRDKLTQSPSDLSMQKAAATVWDQINTTAYSELETSLPATADARNTKSPTSIEVMATIQDAVEYVRQVSKEHETVSIFVTGSLYLVGGLLTVLEKGKA